MVKESIISNAESEIEPGNSNRRPKRRWRIALSLIVLFALAVWPTLIGMGAFLVYDEASNGYGSHLLLLDAAEVDSVAAGIQRQHPGQRLLILAKLPGRPMELGVLPPFDVYIRNRLEKEGVPKDAIEVIPGSSTDQVTQVRQLKDWMATHPEVTVVALTDQLSGRTWRKLLDQILAPDEAKRVHLHAVVQSKVNSSNWWRSKAGIIFVLQQYITFLYSGEGAKQ